MKTGTRIALSVGLLVVGGAITAALIFLAPEAETGQAERPEPEVEVEEVGRSLQVMHIPATGTVEAADELQLVPQVSGEIVWVDDELDPGTRYAAGEALARVDPANYEAALAQARSQLQQARVQLEQAQARSRTAERETELLDGLEQSPLTRNEPQLESARQVVESAEAALERSRRDLDRTWLRAPFDASVVTESISLGSVVGPSQPVARLVGTDELWVRASIPVARLSAVELPTEDASGSSATVRQTLGNQDAIERAGRVDALVSELEPETRTAQLLISIDEPWGEAGELPLLPGAFVDIEIHGRAIEGSHTIAREALRRGDEVWLVNDAGELQTTEVTVAWKTADEAYITAGLQAGDRVITSPLANAVDGMAVTLADQPSG